MSGDRFRIEIISLVNKFRSPAPSSPRTRENVPSGYGTREQCRPFVAAAALGFSIPSPFGWGFCLPDDVPTGARSFRSPITGGCADRLFYVLGDPAYGFEHNQFSVPDEIAKLAGPFLIPGLSFFNRSDQQDMVKLHLPYIFRTHEDCGILFLPPINRDNGRRPNIMSGLVETGWYADAVNLAIGLPSMPSAIHIAAGETIAQAVPMAMDAAKSDLVLLAQHRRKARDTLSGMAEWKSQHDKDRSAYKRLSKAHLTKEESRELVG